MCLLQVGRLCSISNAVILNQIPRDTDHKHWKKPEYRFYILLLMFRSAISMVHGRRQRG
jgi:hypothetical protein